MHLVTKMVVALTLALSMTACGNPIEAPENDAFTFADRTAEPTQITDLRLSIVVTATAMAPEAIMFEGGQLFTQRKMAHSAILVCHPDGLFMFDTGLGRDIDTQFEAMSGFLKPLFSYEVTAPVMEQLDQEEFCPGRALQIAVSHLHWDHASGIEDFPDAPVWVPEIELAQARELENGSGYLANQFDAPDINWQMIEFTDNAYANYSRSYDFFEDGSVVLVPMIGHTEGSVGMFVELGEGNHYFFTGDITWSVEGFARPAHRHALMRAIVDSNVDDLEREIMRVHALMENEPSLHIVPAHDYEAYMQGAIYPAFISGDQVSSLQR